ncbi:MAG: Gfo/Idh/MocA family oxidoreductase [Chloroflexi bacterium]|nr:Gfo/Idh/MocA family oxidoreductase [Chloroflexota bacterium]
MKRVRAAIVGSGGMGHARAAHLSLDDRAQIVCVSSRNPVTGRALAERFGVECVEGWEHLVQRDDVDAVCVATHNDSHAPIARAALEAGKHVLVEYPLALDVADADQLIDLASRSGLVLHVGHDQALVGWHLAIKQEAAALGRLLAVNSVLATPTRGGGRSVWRNVKLSGPPFIVGIAYVFHLLDAFGPMEWVDGTSTYEGLEDSGYYRSSVSTLTASFVNGGVAQLLYIRGFTVPRDEQEQAMMFSDGFLSYRGYVSGSPTNEGHLTRVTRAGVQRLDFPAVTLAVASRQNTEHFLSEVLDGVPVVPPTRTSRDAVAVAFAAEQAAQERGRVYLGRTPERQVR